MLLHSKLSKFEAVEAKTAAPSTILYFVSPPLPPEINDLRITIVSHNQGFCDDPDQCSWTWFEASILRRWSECTQEDFGDLSLSQQPRTCPEDFGDDIQERGWYFVNLPVDRYERAGDEIQAAVSQHVLTVPMSREWQSHQINWSQQVSQTRINSESSVQNQLKLLEEGDRLAIWARAQFPTWTTYVKEVRVELSAASHDQALATDQLITLIGHNDADGLPSTRRIFSREIDALNRQKFDHAVASNISNTTGSTTNTETRGLNMTGNSVVQRPMPESVVSQELGRLFRGEWIICDHRCRSADHRHPVSVCGCHDAAAAQQNDAGQLLAFACRGNSTDSDSENITRDVRNPCSHYPGMDPVEDLRLILVCNGTIDDPLELILRRVSRHSTHTNYMALSYCWGSLDHTRQITLNHIYRYPREEEGKPGVCFRHPFNITKSLHGALVSFRAQCPVFPLWVDSVCIEQTNVQERNHQVTLMGETYSKAAMVVIWLDLDPRISEWAYEAITKLVENLKDRFGNDINGYQLTQEHIDFLDNNHICSDKGCHQPRVILNHVLRHPWFRRVWVLQEVFRANMNAFVFMSGAKPLLFSEILILLVYHQFRVLGPHQQKHLTNAPMLWCTLGELLTNPSNRLSKRKLSGGKVSLDVTAKHKEGQQASEKKCLSILDLFSQTIIFEATRPKDKIYALLGLGKETRDHTNLPDEIRPDYDKSDSQVYSDFTRYCVKQSKTLAIFSVVSKTVRSNFVDPNSSIIPSPYSFPPKDHPTWALWYAPKERWTDEVAYNPRYPGYANSDSPMLDIALLESDLDPTHLLLKGINLDEVHTVLPLVFKNYSENEAFRTDTTPPSATSSSLHEIWDLFIRDFQSRKASQGITGQGSTPYLDETDLFDNFLLTIICDACLPVERYGLDVPPEQRARPSQDESVMAFVIAHWVLSHPDAFQAKRDKVTGRKMIEAEHIIKSTHLPIPIVKHCDETVPNLLKSGGFVNRKYEFDYWLHHTLGHCFFISVQGYIGLCPYGTQPGDRVVALWGAKYASVLRVRGDDKSKIDNRSPMDDEKGWMFVGELLVHAWMDGRYVRDLMGREEGRKEEIYVLV